MVTETCSITSQQNENSISDSGLRKKIMHALSASGHQQLNRIEIAVNQGVVTLTGQVDSYFAKQLAQNIIIQIGFDAQIVNQLSVVRQRFSG